MRDAWRALVSLIFVFAFAHLISASITATYVTKIDGTDVGEWNKFKSPSDVLVYEGKLYIVDTGNARVEIYNASDNKYMRTIGGVTGGETGQFNSPTCVYIDASGIYISDTQNHRIQTYGLDGSQNKIFGDRGGGSEDNQFYNPCGSFVTGDRIYVADTFNNRIQVVNLTDNAWISRFGSKGPLDGQFFHPTGMRLVGDNIYIADTLNDRVQIYSSNFTFLTRFGWGSGSARLKSPWNFWVTKDRIYVADSGNNRIAVFSAKNLSFIDSIETYGSEKGQLDSPRGVYVEGSKMYVADTNNNRVQIFALRDTELESEAVLKTEAGSALSSANAAINNLRSALNPASGITMRTDDLSVPSSSAAQEAYDAGDYGTAVTLALSVAKDAGDKTELAEYRIGEWVLTSLTKMKSKLNGVRSALAYYSLNVSLERAELKINETTLALNSKNYTGAITSVRQLENEITSLEALIQPARENLERVKAALSFEIGTMNAEVSKMNSLVAEYHQLMSFNDISSTLFDAEKALKEDNLPFANLSLARAKEKLASARTALNTKMAQIDDARTALVEARAKIQSAETQSSILISASLDEAHSLARESDSSLYTDPVRAKELAGTANRLASAEEARINSMKPLVYGGLFVLILIIGGVAYWAYNMGYGSGRRGRPPHWHRGHHEHETHHTHHASHEPHEHAHSHPEREGL